MPFDQDDRQTLQGAITSVIVPANIGPSLDETLEGQPEIEQRSTLFFDERLKVLVFLEVPACPEERLHAYLEQLDLRVDAWAISAQNGEERSPIDGAPTRDMIASQPVTKLDDPFTLVKQDEDDADIRLQLVWEVELTLGRPRLRALEQTVVFLPIATVNSTEEESDDGDYLEPFSVLEPDVLSPLNGLPGLNQPPYLPLSRLEKVLTTPPKKDDRIRIRHQASDPIRAYAAVIPRLKYNKINASLTGLTTIASLDIEMIPFVEISGTIQSVDVSLSNGKATSFMPDFLPMPCKSKDCITFLYSLQSAQRSGSSTPADLSPSSASAMNPVMNLNIDILAISILITLQLSEGAYATIQMSWTTNVDFSLPLNPAYGVPAQPLQRTNRPTSLNFAPYPSPNKSKAQTRDRAVNAARAASTSLQQQMVPRGVQQQSLLSTSILSISFIAPPEPAFVGVSFSWRVLIVNNSPRPVKLAIVPLPRITRPTTPTQHFAKRHAPKASNASLALPPTTTNRKHTRNAPSTARAIVEEQVLYALHHASPSSVPPEIDLVSLTAELRIGPLGVGQCHETEVRFVAYKAGVLSVDAMRVVDLARESENGVGVIHDIRELPEVVVVEGEEEGEEDYTS